jgi:hypothetical protein
METGVVYAFVSKSYKSVMIEYSKNRYKIITDNNTIDDSFDPNNIEEIVLNNKRELINYIKRYSTTNLIKDNINTIINSIKKFKKAVIKTE